MIRQTPDQDKIFANPYLTKDLYPKCIEKFQKLNIPVTIGVAKKFIRIFLEHVIEKPE